jgi:hypothetical protein
MNPLSIWLHPSYYIKPLALPLTVASCDINIIDVRDDHIVSRDYYIILYYSWLWLYVPYCLGVCVHAIRTCCMGVCVHTPWEHVVLACVHRLYVDLCDIIQRGLIYAMRTCCIWDFHVYALANTYICPCVGVVRCDYRLDQKAKATIPSMYIIMYINNNHIFTCSIPVMCDFHLTSPTHMSLSRPYP